MTKEALSGLAIREEEPRDVAAVHEVNARAFGRELEARLADALRDNGKVVLSLVAEVEGRVVGHVMFSGLRIEPRPPLFRGAALGPIGVLPELQGRGIGSALVREGLERCRQMGYGAVGLLGNPAYYGRFGFKPGHSFGIDYATALPNPDAFQLVELHSGALLGVSGTASEEREFEMAE